MLFVGGLFLLLFTRPDTFEGLSWGWGGLTVTIPTLAEWETGLLRGTLPQVPLTLLNSVIAVCALSTDLYPKAGIPTRPMALSVGLMTYQEGHSARSFIQLTDSMMYDAKRSGGNRVYVYSAEELSAEHTVDPTT